MAPTLYMLCGLPGSGKTTRARQLEAEGRGIVLNADSWVCRFYPDDAEAAARDERKALVQDVQWELAEQLLTAGLSVILDHGVSKRAERDHYRGRCAVLGVEVQTIFLDRTLETLQQRIADRNRRLPPGTFHIDPGELDEWAGQFERPSADEATID